MRFSIVSAARLAILLSIALTLAAMLLYPGGTTLDRASSGYSLTQNFLSDLGMTIAYNGGANEVGAVCFVASVCILVPGLGGAVAGLLPRFAATSAGRRLAYAAGGMALLACFAFLAVAFTPEDQAMRLHIRLTFLAFHLLPAAALLVTLAARASRAVSPRGVAAWAALTVSLIAYAALLDCGPRLDTRAGLGTYVLAQKLVAVAVVLAVACQTATLCESVLHAEGSRPKGEAR